MVGGVSVVAPDHLVLVRCHDSGLRGCWRGNISRCSDARRSVLFGESRKVDLVDTVFLAPGFSVQLADKRRLK